MTGKIGNIWCDWNGYYGRFREVFSFKHVLFFYFNKEILQKGVPKGILKKRKLLGTYRTTFEILEGCSHQSKTLILYLLNAFLAHRLQDVFRLAIVDFVWVTQS